MKTQKTKELYYKFVNQVLPGLCIGFLLVIIIPVFLIFFWPENWKKINAQGVLIVESLERHVSEAGQYPDTLSEDFIKGLGEDGLYGIKYVKNDIGYRLEYFSPGYCIFEWSQVQDKFIMDYCS